MSILTTLLGWGITQPMFPEHMETVTPDDSATFEPSAVLVVTAGDVTFLPSAKGAVAQTLTMDAKTWIPVTCSKVYSTGTTATTIKRVW